MVWREWVFVSSLLLGALSTVALAQQQPLKFTGTTSEISVSLPSFSVSGIVLPRPSGRLYVSQFTISLVSSTVCWFSQAIVSNACKRDNICVDRYQDFVVSYESKSQTSLALDATPYGYPVVEEDVWTLSAVLNYGGEPPEGFSVQFQYDVLYYPADSGRIPVTPLWMCTQCMMNNNNAMSRVYSRTFRAVGNGTIVGGSAGHPARGTPFSDASVSSMRLDDVTTGESLCKYSAQPFSSLASNVCQMNKTIVPGKDYRFVVVRDSATNASLQQYPEMRMMLWLAAYWRDAVDGSILSDPYGLTPESNPLKCTPEKPDEMPWIAWTVGLFLFSLCVGFRYLTNSPHLPLTFVFVPQHQH